MAIQVQGVTKKFGAQKALDNVSFSIPAGQVVGFLGPNGAGKSTMMKIVTGFIKPSIGNVLVNGVSISNPNTDFRRSIGYLPENNPLYPDMFVKEYLCFVAKIYKLGKIGEKRVRELVELTGIGHEQNKKIGQLSRGYRQRVGLAQALLNRPSVLILDEPTSGLDPNQIVEIRKIIADVGKEKTVLLSTHIMQEVEAICSRVLILNHGKIVADDSTRNILLHHSASMSDVLVEFAATVDSDLLEQIPGVKSVFLLPEGQNSWLLGSDANVDIRSNIFNFCAQNGLTLITLKKKSMQMEHVFQTLTQS